MTEIRCPDCNKLLATQSTLGSLVVLSRSGGGKNPTVYSITNGDVKIICKCGRVVMYEVRARMYVTSLRVEA